MINGRLGIVFCVVFSCLALPVTAMKSLDDDLQESPVPKAPDPETTLREENASPYRATVEPANTPEPAPRHLTLQYPNRMLAHFFTAFETLREQIIFLLNQFSEDVRATVEAAQETSSVSELSKGSSEDLRPLSAPAGEEPPVLPETRKLSLVSPEFD